MSQQQTTEEALAELGIVVRARDKHCDCIQRGDRANPGVCGVERILERDVPFSPIRLNTYLADRRNQFRRVGFLSVGILLTYVIG